MSDLLLPYVVLAQASPLEHIAREFQGRQTRVESGYLATGLLIVASVVVAVWILSKVLERYGGRRPIDSSTLLFLSLCRAHRLRWSERWLLWRIARDQRLKDPARLFLEPERLDPAKMPSALRHRGAELGAILGRLFSGLPAEDIAGPEPGLDKVGPRSASR